MEITQEQIEKYEADKKAFDAHMESIKPREQDFVDLFFDQDGFNKAMREWQMSCSCDAPNKPGYYRANND